MHILFFIYWFMQVKDHIQWIKNIATVWAVSKLWPYSSQKLADMLVRSLDEWVWKKDHIRLVEFWAGPWNISREILSHPKIQSYRWKITLALYETLPSNIEYLKVEFSSSRLDDFFWKSEWFLDVYIQWSAETVWIDFESWTVDGIVTTIPVTLLPDSVLETIFEWAKDVLTTEAPLISWQYRKNDIYNQYFTQEILVFRPILSEKISFLLENKQITFFDIFPPVLLSIFKK